MQTLLANLVNNLKLDEFHDFKKIYMYESNTELLTSKEFIPYDYVNSINKFQETKLPPMKEFYSKLNDTHITNEDDYDHAKNVYKTFNCKTIKDYHNLYLTTDALLLADAFENFRNTCYPCHYYRSPG